MNAWACTKQLFLLSKEKSSKKKTHIHASLETIFEVKWKKGKMSTTSIPYIVTLIFVRGNYTKQEKLSCIEFM